MKQVFTFISLLVFLYAGFMTDGSYAQPQQQEKVVFEDDVKDDTRGLLWLGMLLLGALLYQGLQVYKRLYPHTMLSSKQVHQLHTTRQRLIQQIAQLDEQFAREEIEHNLYAAIRTRQKEILLELTMVCQHIRTQDMNHL